MMSHKANLNEFKNNQIEKIYKLTMMEINFKKDTWKVPKYVKIMFLNNGNVLYICQTWWLII